MSKKVNLAGMEVELAPGVHLSTERKKRPSCYILDTADRFIALLGKPSELFVMDMVKQHERWTHSEDETCQAIFHEEYVYKAQLMEYQSGLQIPSGGMVTSPSEFQETENPEIYIERRRLEAINIMVKLKAGVLTTRAPSRWEGTIRKIVDKTDDDWADLVWYQIHDTKKGWDPFNLVFQERIPYIADHFLSMLRLLRMLEFYLTSALIEEIEKLINFYMITVFQQYYYL